MKLGLKRAGLLLNMCKSNPMAKKESSNDLNTDQEKENNFVLNGNRYSMVTTLR